MLRTYIPDNVGVVHELIAERQAAAKHE